MQRRWVMIGPLSLLAGGIAAISGPSQVEKLPAATGKFHYGLLSQFAPKLGCALRQEG